MANEFFEAVYKDFRMKEITLPDSHLIKNSKEKSKTESLQKSWLLVLYFCGFGGIFIALTGLFMSGLSHFRLIENDLNIHQIGTILIVAAFPLIMFGAHALDKIGELKRRKSKS